MHNPVSLVQQKQSSCATLKMKKNIVVYANKGLILN